ncbi:MAG: hypothetical protein IH991_20240 [Planctomycetes bacterium]|nr:hypothetical protein [Planctomycetota bacterium]
MKLVLSLLVIAGVVWLAFGFTRWQERIDAIDKELENTQNVYQYGGVSAKKQSVHLQWWTDIAIGVGCWVAAGILALLTRSRDSATVPSRPRGPASDSELKLVPVCPHCGQLLSRSEGTQERCVKCDTSLR